ncbi:uncharacterized protein LOC129607805 [Condylostylus longicornis]|uniref:uncharacterized protein LOC129607805 n=1 Tax=Condylostylus longicornis TaxID=2530218 RepID=UPI00244DB999|nr:uncharacterized protein LOC129607805 [Condylostylus longicornis]
MTSPASRTGLIPASKSLFKSTKPQTKIYHDEAPSFNLIPYKLCQSIELSIRPFGDLYNPYSTRCSVLCNHPAPRILRSIIKNAKHSKLQDVKSYSKQDQQKFETFHLDENGVIPEEFYQRYRETDSRPLSPSPTNISEKTRTSGTGSMVNRRCITPEWGKFEINKRKQLILDLRRSHSQDTIASKDITSEMSHFDDRSKLDDQKSAPQIKRPDSKTVEGKAKTDPTTCVESPSDDQENQEDDNDAVQPTTCINDRDDFEEQEEQRRGKKRKKLKQPPTTFHLNKDPETQISTLGPESVAASTRPSLIPTTELILPVATSSMGKRSVEYEALKESFLTTETFKVLSTGLDIDVLEDTFEKYLYRARKEAMKYLYLKQEKLENSDQPTSASRLPVFPPTIVETGKAVKWYEADQKIPRKLSKSGCRFEIPMNFEELNKMSAFEYLSKYAWVSRQRKSIYRRVFLKFKSAQQEDENGNEEERFIPTENFRKALFDVLGFYGTLDVVTKVEQFVEPGNYEGKLTFRAWCGVAAFSERLALYAHTGGNGGTDSCDELEKSDFDSFEERKIFLKMNKKLNFVLAIIRKVQ